MCIVRVCKQSEQPPCSTRCSLATLPVCYLNNMFVCVCGVVYVCACACSIHMVCARARVQGCDGCLYPTRVDLECNPAAGQDFAHCDTLSATSRKEGF